MVQIFNMIFYIVMLSLGLYSINFCQKCPGFLLCLETVMGIIFLWSLARIFPHRVPKFLIVIIGLIACFGIGFAIADYRANQWLVQRVPNSWVGKNILAAGTIISLPIETTQITRFRMQTEQINGQKQQKLLQIVWSKPHPPMLVGERWLFTLHVKPPHALYNPGRVNRQREFWLQNIHGSGYIPLHAQNIRLATSSWSYFLQRWRQSLQQIIHDSVHDPSAAAIICALTIGVENALSDHDWQILRSTGTSHLIAISGLHMGLMAVIAYFLINRLWRRSTQLMLRYSAQQASAIFAMMFAFAYGALAGFGLATMRSVIMIIMLMLAQVFYRSASVWRRLLIAYVIVITCQPQALFFCRILAEFCGRGLDCVYHEYRTTDVALAAVVTNSISAVFRINATNIVFFSAIFSRQFYC